MRFPAAAQVAVLLAVVALLRRVAALLAA